MDLVKKINLLHNHVLKVYREEDAESPNDWDNEDVFLIYDHRQFTVKRKGYEPKDIYDYTKDIVNNSLEEGINNKYSNFFIFTVYAYIHSDVSLSLNRGTDRFDTSSTGFILVDKNNFDLQRKHDTKVVDKTNEEIAIHYAQGLIDTWNQYLSGQVYRYKLYKLIPYIKCYINDDLKTLKNKIITFNAEDIKFKKDKIDSCGGYYCDKLSEILDSIDKKLYNDTIKQLLDE